MRNKLILVAIGGSMLLASPALRADEPTNNPAPAHAHKGGPRAGAPERLIPPPVAEKLNLTEDQKSKIKPIEESFAKTHQEYVAAHKAEVDAARAAMEEAKTSNDPAKKKEAWQKREQAMAGLQPQRKAAVEQIKSLLTDEQKKIWQDAAKEFREKRGGKAGGAPAPPPSN